MRWLAFLTIANARPRLPSRMTISGSCARYLALILGEDPISNYPFNCHFFVPNPCPVPPYFESNTLPNWQAAKDRPQRGSVMVTPVISYQWQPPLLFSDRPVHSSLTVTRGRS
jgi:hypothetical protein